MQLEKAMLEKALQEKQSQVEQIKKMRESYRTRMEAIDEELAELSVGAKPESQVGKTSTPLQRSKQKQQPQQSNRCDNLEEIGSNGEETSSSESNTSDSQSDMGNESVEEISSKVSCRSSRTTSSQGLRTRRVGPSKAQLSARHGINRKLPSFSGKAEEWPLFISSYTSSTEACGYNDVENLVRLQESLTGPALDSVRGLLLFPKCVSKVIIKLRRLYGRPELLLQHYVEKIRKLESPKADRLASYIPFGNAVELLCDHLEAAELQNHLNNPTLIQDLLSKLPAVNQREWVRYKKRKTVVNLRTFANFLSKVVAEICETNVDVRVAPDTQRLKPKEKAVVFSHNTDYQETSNVQKPCKACGRTDHRLRFCDVFKGMPKEERFELAEKWKLCHICLNDHGRLPCRFHRIRCDVGECRERHHPLLHSTQVVMNTHFPTSFGIMFRVVPVRLYFGKSVVETLAFLDDGASVTLLEKSLAKRLELVGEKDELTIKWTADVSRIEKESIRADMHISSRSGDEKLLLRNVRTVSDLRLPKQNLNHEKLKEQYPFLKDVPVESYLEARPGILIGLNNLEVIAPLETKIGNIGDPVAVRSKLGWSIYGPIQNLQVAQPNAYVGIHAEPTNQEIYDLIKVQYVVEESPVTVTKESKEDQRARELLEKTTVRIGNRFETGLLWNKDDIWFPDSYGMAFNRMQQLEKRLARTPELYVNVCKQIEEYLKKGYAHEITPDELTKTEKHKAWYLPLNVVLNPKKPSKVRLVWDAAATVNGVSLNSQLLKGPDTMVSLPAVISRFRERPVAFGADIKEMYHQIRIRTDDRQAQRFLFRKDPCRPPTTYVMDVATFGAACSPCSAQFVKNRNANEFATEYPEAANAILYNHYVDDYYHSTDTPEEAIHLATEVRQIHSKGGFDIRNWVSNSNLVLEGIGEPNSDNNVHFNKNKETETERVLGIIWDPHDDVFSFSTAHRDNVQCYLKGDSRPTKRIVLSCVMGFFDPLGLLSPFTVHGRILIQDLWRSGCEWDTLIDDDSFAKWKRWTGVLSLVEDLRIERCYTGSLRSSEIQSLEVHAFTDASENAYGCAIYFRVKWSGGIKVSLVMSSAKNRRDTRVDKCIGLAMGSE
ncbi:uncharacterized protein LOC129743369 [Uranotaenia lowii]|uniref:uncharacterized protein LOC129743369 n=1 Tax=Uranotaenia lowii TaxID=190385 RepID=UPI00247A5655|nr:uncharacterized protein LOC129743369 [Uranotaenia lowii]